MVRTLKGVQGGVNMCFSFQNCYMFRRLVLFRRQHRSSLDSGSDSREAHILKETRFFPFTNAALC
jgi:hypothetical protein